jgi:predicted RNase H-like nuclease (RuvC/YqgF family)
MNYTDLEAIVNRLAVGLAEISGEIPRLRAEVQSQVDWERSYTRRVEALEERYTDMHKAIKQIIEDVTRLAYHVGLEDDGPPEAVKENEDATQ